MTTYSPFFDPEFITDREGSYCAVVDQLDHQVSDPLLREHYLSRGAVGFDVASLVENPPTGIHIQKVVVDQGVEAFGLPLNERGGFRV